MKHIIYLFVITLCFTACKKELGACKDYKEITGREELSGTVNVDFKAFKDTLAKYPQLQAYDYSSTQYNKSMMCYTYYKDLMVFSDLYSLYKSSTADTIQKIGNIIKTDLGISLQPGISYKDAIENAKKYANFDHTCISYRLGLFDANMGGSTTRDYRLAWKIMSSDSKYIFVISDANSNRVFQVNNGRYWLY